MKKIYFFTAVITIAATSCHKNDEIIFGKDLTNNFSEVIILQERAPDLPDKINFPAPLQTRVADPSAKDFLGAGYKVGNTIIGEETNASAFPVVNLQKLDNSPDSTYARIHVNRDTDTNMQADSDWDRYEEKKWFSSKFKTGFELNIKAFSIGRESTFEERFNSVTVAENQKVYGEIGIEYRHNRHELQIEESPRRRIAAKYLDNTFRTALYTSPMAAIRREYGDFIITAYFSGGRATALYLGQYAGSENYEGREKAMTQQLKGSFKKNDTEGSGSLEFGYRVGDSISAQNKVTRLYSQIKTTGGQLSEGVDAVAKSVELNSFNLNGWLRSLNDASTHTMIGIKDKGLYPLWDYLLEENFRIRLSDYYSGFLEEYPVMVTPFIEISKIYVKTVNGERLYDVVPIINTRHADKLIISKIPSSRKTDAELRTYNDYDSFMSRAQQITAEIGEFFQCEIRAYPNVVYNPALRDPLIFDLSGIDFANMNKHVDMNTGMRYLFHIDKMIALSYHSMDFIMATYGAYSWSNSLQPNPIVDTDVISSFFKVYGL